MGAHRSLCAWMGSILAVSLAVAGVSVVPAVASAAPVGGVVAATPPPAAGGLVALTPARVLDTATGTGAAKGAVKAGKMVSLKVTGHGGVPLTGVAAVVLNVTVTKPGTGGSLTAYPAGARRPGTPALYFSAGQTVSNLVVAKVGAGGEVDLHNGSKGSVQILADVSGWFASVPAAPAAGGLSPLPSARILGSGSGAGQTIGAGKTIALQVAGRGGVPAAGAAAVVLNVTVTRPKSGGSITEYPAGVARPSTPELYFSAGKTVAGLVVARVGAGGAIDLHNGSKGTVQVLADVSGWFTPPASVPASGGFASLLPGRDLDTVTGTGVKGAVGAGKTIALTVTGRGGVPAAGVAAVVLEVTATAPKAAGSLTEYPAGAKRPGTPDLSFAIRQTVSNLVVARVGAGGKVEFYNGSKGSVQVFADVHGWFAVLNFPVLSGVASVVGGGDGFCAVLKSGRVDCWGDNGFGELGDGGTKASDVPVAVRGVGGTGVLTGVASVSADESGLGYCAVLTSGGVDCWGYNFEGQLGDGTMTQRDTPVAVHGVGGSGTLGGVSRLTSGQYGHCALLTSGGVDCWGANSQGQLGIGSASGPDLCGVAEDACGTTPVTVAGPAAAGP